MQQKKIEDLETARVIVPQLTEDLKEQNVPDDIFWHNNEAKQVEKKLGSATGLFIRKEMCMFIPAPSFHEMYVFKEIKIGQKPITEHTLFTIGATAVLQFNKIDQQLENLPNRSGKAEKIKVVFIIYKVEASKKANTEKAEPGTSKDSDWTEWSNFFEREFRENHYEHIRPSCKVLKESEVNDRLFGQNNQKKRLPRSTNLALLAVQMYKCEMFGMESSNEVFRLPGGDNMTFSDEDKVEKCFLQNFPPDRLHIVPDIDSLFDNHLYQTDETGMLVDTDKHFSYSGEVKFFYQHFVSKLSRNQRGIYLKDFQPKHVSKLFNWPFIRNYQIDWMFLGLEQIVVFEVGLVKDPLEPKTALNSKLKQVRTNLKSLMKLILRGIIMSYQTDRRTREIEEFWAFFKTKISFVIYLPNANPEAVGRCLENRSNCHKLAKTSDPDLLVICPTKQLDSEESGCLLKTFGITSNDQVAFNRKVSINEILTTSMSGLHSSEKDSHGQNNCFEEQLVTITPMLTLSFLTVVDLPWRPLEVEERYHEGFKKRLQTISDCTTHSDCPNKSSDEFARKLGLPKVNNHSLILSPEQLQILMNETNRYLIVRGEAGTGKTILLLMKASLLALDSAIQKIYLVIPESKTMLNTFLQKFISENKSILNDKLEILEISINSLSTFLTQIRAQLDGNLSSGADRVALFVDEFYYYSAYEFRFLPTAYCWINVVTGCGETLELDFFFSGTKFKEVHLHVLLRSAEHISRAGQNLSYRIRDVDETTATVPGAFISSQQSVEVFNEDFSNDKCNLLKMFEKYYSKTNRKFDESRFVIIITGEKRKRLWVDIGKRYSKRNQFFVEVLNDAERGIDFNQMSFTGAECMSVIVIVDASEIVDTLPYWSEEHYYPPYDVFMHFVYAALTRACYEAIVVSNWPFLELEYIEQSGASLNLYRCLLKGEGIPSSLALASTDGEYYNYEIWSLVKQNRLNKSIKNSCSERKRHLLLAIVKRYYFETESLWNVTGYTGLVPPLRDDPLLCSLAHLSKTTYNMRDDDEAEEVLWKLWKELLDDLLRVENLTEEFLGLTLGLVEDFNCRIDIVETTEIYLQKKLLYPLLIRLLQSANHFNVFRDQCHRFINTPAIVSEMVDRWIELRLPTAQMDYYFEHFLYTVCLGKLRDENFLQEVDRLFQLLVKSQYPLKHLLSNKELMKEILDKEDYILAKFLLDFDDRIDADIRERYKMELSRCCHFLSLP